MNYLKDKKAITPEYVTKLHDHIIATQAQFFGKGNEADAWRDFVLFPQLKTDRDHLCLPTEPMLIDRSVDGMHWYCICTISENGKVTSELPVIQVNRIDTRYWRNGYFLLPIL